MLHLIKPADQTSELIAEAHADPMPLFPVMIAVWFAGLLTGLMLHYGYLFLLHCIGRG